MSIAQFAKDFYDAVEHDRHDDYRAMWADNIVSMEPGDGPMSRVEGRDQLMEKHQWWFDNAEVHSVKMDGPFVVGDQFAIRYEMDVTMMGERSETKETGVYTVRDGKIAEERFFYGQ